MKGFQFLRKNAKKTGAIKRREATLENVQSNGKNEPIENFVDR